MKHNKKAVCRVANNFHRNLVIFEIGLTFPIFDIVIPIVENTLVCVLYFAKFDIKIKLYLLLTSHLGYNENHFRTSKKLIPSH